eukprot:sb/3470910/
MNTLYDPSPYHILFSDNGAFPLAPQGAAPGGRLILKEAEGHSLPIGFSNRLNEEPATYDTLARVKGGNSPGGDIAIAADGQYNTLPAARGEVPQEEEDLYNIPTASSQKQSQQQTTLKNDYVTHPRVRGSQIENEEEDIYNVPTLRRGPNYLPPDLMLSDEEQEVNAVYASRTAAEICGTPIETDFDNIIYDNI